MENTKYGDTKSWRESKEKENKGSNSKIKQSKLFRPAAPKPLYKYFTTLPFKKRTSTFVLKILKYTDKYL